MARLTTLLLIASTVLLGNQSVAAQEPELINRPDGKFLIHATSPLAVSGLQISSGNGILIPGTSAKPFGFTISATPNEITLASIPDVTLNGLQLMDMGWDIARPDEYDARMELGAGGCAIGFVGPGIRRERICSNVVDFGRLYQGSSLDLKLFRDAFTLVGERNGGPPILLESFSINGSGATAFDIANFEPLPLSAGRISYDVLIDINLPFGVYEASAAFEASQDNQALTSSFPFSVEILRPGDCNADANVDADDLSCAFQVAPRDAVLEVLNSLPGDLDGDGQIDFTDFLTLSANFGVDPASYSDGNIDLQGGVAFADFLILSSNFGKNPAAVSSVPEPANSMLVTIGLACSLLFLRTTSRRHEQTLQ